ncbi:MAG TPA: metallophosphoesterase family protein [Terriglobia bacterium]|nr:metallophosphoesterase family protein [Terriglobia bacterium]
MVSDTHGFFDPALRQIFAGVKEILHAGDVGSPEVLDELRLIAPVRAVKGNVDSAELGLPLSLKGNIGLLQIEMLHILPGLQSELEGWAQSALLQPRESRKQQAFLRSFDPVTRLIIFGHSHEPCLVSLSRIAFFNPGSAGKKRFSLPRCCGLMNFVNGGVELTIVALEGYNRAVVKRMSLRLGE